MVVDLGRGIGVSYFSNFYRIINFVFLSFLSLFLSHHCYISKGHHNFCIYWILSQKQCFSEVATANISHFQVPSYRHCLEYQGPDHIAFSVTFCLFEGVFSLFCLTSLVSSPFHGVSQAILFYSLHS